MATSRNTKAPSQPGPALDAAVARAIGWHHVEPGRYIPYGNWADAEDRGMYAPDVWNPSEEIEYAIRAAVEMNRCGWHVMTGLLEQVAMAEATRDFGKQVEVIKVPYTETGGDEERAIALAISRAIEATQGESK